MSACGAIVETRRRAQGVELSGKSKDSNSGVRVFRFWTRNKLRQYWSDLGDGYQPLVFSGLSSRRAGLESSTSGGKSGQTGGPSDFFVRSPLTKRSESRSCSAVARRGVRNAK